MLIQLLILMFAVTAFGAPSPQDPSTPHLDCTFTAQITEICRYNDKHARQPNINTEARINGITSPKGNQVVSYTEGLHINYDPLVIYTNEPQEIIVGELDVARSGNSGDVNFKWTWNPSGGRPLTEGWTESKNGTGDRYGCFVKDWDKGATPACDRIQPVTQRCWFKCTPTA